MSGLLETSNVPTHGSFLEVLRLNNWPLRYEWRMTSCLVGLSLVVFCVVATGASSVLLPLAVFTAILISLWRVWIPVSFELNSVGITQQVLRVQSFMPWTEFTYYEEYSSGVLLMRDSNPSPLARLSGSFIHWDGHRSEVLSFLDHHLVDRRKT